MYWWDEGAALVQTVDFFTPVVDDPATYGAIAAANALSDVYAMGGRPLTALAIAGFPKDEIDETTIRAIFLGGLHKLREAGVALLGGHTVQDPEIKFGYAVTGVVSPDAVWRNSGARPGDVLFLTKPIGTGVIATAIKFERAAPDTADAAIEVMLELNRAAAGALLTLPPGSVHACTDITGFGLLGHATEMAQGSGLTLALDVAAIPLIRGALELSANRSGGMKTNEQYLRPGRARAGRHGSRDALAPLQSADLGRPPGRRGPGGGRRCGRGIRGGRRRRGAHRCRARRVRRGHRTAIEESSIPLGSRGIS